MKMTGKRLLGLFIVPGMTLVFGALGWALGFATVILMRKYGIGGIGRYSVAGAGYFYLWYRLLTFVCTVVGFLIGSFFSVRGMRRWSDQKLMVLGIASAVLLALVIVASTFGFAFILPFGRG